MEALNQSIGKKYALYNGDCIELIKALPDNSIHFSIFSPPFAHLYVFSDSSRDLSNCKSYEDFFTHFAYLSKELYRVLMPGRLMAVHCINMPTTLNTHGVIGIKDFRGDLIRHFQENEFIYHSEVTIWKDPATAMIRTKALGLLHKQLVKDSAMSRQGIPDYLIVLRKPGKNEQPVSGLFPYAGYVGNEEEEVDMIAKEIFHRNNGQTWEECQSVAIWQKYASPVWMDIDQTDTLQVKSAREEKDEKHIAPLQRGVIERAVQLWTNPGDTVLTPFAGIGSELYYSLLMGRRAIGFELKESYYKQAVLNLESVDGTGQQSLLEMLQT